MENTYIIPQAPLPCQDCVPKQSLKFFVEFNLRGAGRHSPPSFQGLLFPPGEISSVCCFWCSKHGVWQLHFTEQENSHCKIKVMGSWESSAEQWDSEYERKPLRMGPDQRAPAKRPLHSSLQIADSGVSRRSWMSCWRSWASCSFHYQWHTSRSKCACILRTQLALAMLNEVGILLRTWEMLKQ